MRRFPSSLLQFTSRDRVPTFYALGMLTGAAWYFSVDFEPTLLWIVVGAISSGLTALFSRRLQHNALLHVIAIIAFSSTLGALAGSLATQRLSHVQIDQPVGPVMVEGWITRIEPAKRGVRLVIRVHAMDGVSADQTPDLVRLTQISRLETEPGRFVRCWAALRPPPAPVIQGDYAFDRQAWYSGLGGVGYVQGRCQGGGVGAPPNGAVALELEIGKVRRRLGQHVRASAGERAGGFAAALASGDRSFLSQADQEALRRAGLAHLLAISGLHIGIVGGLVFALVWRGLALIEPLALRYSVKKPAAAAALMVCGAYLVLSGASVSTQRAYVMALVFFGAVLFDRAALTQRSLAIAMIIIIVMAPWSVLTPGFQMSFAATLVLIATYEAWKERRQADLKSPHGVGFWIKSIAVTSFVTSLATMPFALYHFERAAGLGILANMLAMPIISLVSAPFAAGALLLSPFGLEGAALRAFGYSLEWVLNIAHTVRAWGFFDGVALPKMPATSLSLFAATMISMCVLARSRGSAVIAAIFIMSAVGVWLMSARDRIHWAPSGDVYLETAFGKVERIGFYDGDGLGPLRFSDAAKNASCPEEENCFVPFQGDTIALLRENTALNCSELADWEVALTGTAISKCGDDQSPIVVNWSDVVRENGVTLVRRANGFQKKSKPACGKRAWRKCY